MNEIKCDITNATKAFIRGKSELVNLQEPLYAINWFSTKAEWLYHFYNFLAYKSVLKIGGKAFFKGKIERTILDENNISREFILIVKYPNGNGFKQLMETTYFKLVSIFRMLAVKEFSFGFTHKQLASKSSLDDELAYVVHHIKTSEIDSFLFSKFEDVLEEEIKITYAGKIVANLVTKTENKKEECVPNLIDGLVIFECKEEANILKMIASDEYQSLIKTLDSSYIGTLKRII